MSEQQQGWAVRRAKVSGGNLIVDCSPDITEERIWEIALGWPSKEEISWEKKAGGRAFRCLVTEIEK